MSKTGFEFMALLKVSKNESQKFPITITEFRRALVFLHPQYFAFSIHLLIFDTAPIIFTNGAWQCANFAHSSRWHEKTEMAPIFGAYKIVM